MDKKQRPSIQKINPYVITHASGVTEIMWAHNDMLDLLGKVLHMPKGSKGNLQHHWDKHEYTMLFKGEAKLSYDAGDGKVTETYWKEGEAYNTPPGAVHGVLALTDCTFFEVGNSRFNDRNDVAEEYGLQKDAKGLPSTKGSTRIPPWANNV